MQVWFFGLTGVGFRGLDTVLMGPRQTEDVILSPVHLLRPCTLDITGACAFWLGARTDMFARGLVSCMRAYIRSSVHAYIHTYTKT